MEATVKDNILFGREFDETRYNQTINACELFYDISNFQDKDETNIVENGGNLSGGQKQRIALARAAYGDADLYIFDDPFSALDPNVANDIFVKLVSNTGLLQKKARIIITHSMKFLAYCDTIVFFVNGEIRDQGIFTLLNTGFPRIVTALE